MSWMETLWQTFEANQELIGKITTEEDVPLLPICHSTQQAHIEIVIDEEGRFLRANVVHKDDARTIIPVTESSASRSGKKPIHHPLADALQYIAGDFIKYGGKVTSGYAKNPSEPFESYVNDLRNWCSSPYTHSKVRAVLSYIERGTVIRDLVDAGILNIDDNGKLIEKWNRSWGERPEIFQVIANNTPQWRAFVRWMVEKDGDPNSKLWEDPSVFGSWIEYYVAQQEMTGLCYVSGESKKLAILHPAKLINDRDNAKIISANDKSGYTFRGRFVNSFQAVGVSFEISQKAHNALRWLIRNQGTILGDLAVVTWAVYGESIPDPLADSSVLFGGESETEEEKSTAYTGEDFATNLQRRIWGYGTQLDDTSKIVIMGLSAATPGRMAIAFYRELTGSGFLKRLENWHATCAWNHSYIGQYHRQFKKKKSDGFVGAPAPWDIIDAVHGREVDDALKRNTITRLLPSIIDGRQIASDLVHKAVKNASTPHGKEHFEWMKTLTIACSLYRKLHEKEAYKLALEENRRTRDYLYGRLLALAHNIEQWAISEMAESGGRQTNAQRLMQRFADRPFSTWRTIELSLQPYTARLAHKAQGRLREISNIMNLFESDDYSSDRPLSGEFLLGFHCQLQALRNRSQTDIKT